MSNAGRLSFECLLAVIWFVAGCGEAEKPGTGGPSALPEQTRREVIFWNERLSQPPNTAPSTPSPGQRREIAQLAKRLEGAPITKIESTLRQLTDYDELCIPQLEVLLRHAEDEATRRNAVLALTAVGGARGAGVLCSALSDRSAQVALLAARGLGQLGAPWTIPRLIKVLGRYDVTPHLIVRVEAAAALIRLGNHAGVPFLLKVLKEHTAMEDNTHRDWAKRTRIAFEKEAAVEALGALMGSRFGFSPNAPYAAQENAIRKMEAWWSKHRIALWRATPPLEDPALMERVEWLIEGLDVYQIRTVDNARFVLKSLGPKVLPLLAGHFDDPRIYVRMHLLEVCEQIGDLFEPQAKQIISLLEARLDDTAAPVRAQAVRALASLQHPSVTRRMLGGLTDLDPSVRVATIRALGQVGGPLAARALRPLAETSTHDDAWASAHAALYRLGQPEQLADLFGALLDDDLDSQSSALEALGWLGAPIADFPLGQTHPERERACGAIGKALQGP